MFKQGVMRQTAIECTQLDKQQRVQTPYDAPLLKGRVVDAHGAVLPVARGRVCDADHAGRRAQGGPAQRVEDEVGRGRLRRRRPEEVGCLAGTQSHINAKSIVGRELWQGDLPDACQTSS